ncbi:MAG: glycosyltransferase 87 family protein [Gaiellales bacterium]
MAVLVLCGVAQAAGSRLTRSQAVAIAAADPKVAGLVRHNPGAHWEALYDAAKHVWTVALEPKGFHDILGTLTVDDRSGQVVGRSLGPKRGPPRLTAPQAAQLAARDRRLTDWLSLYQHVTHSAVLGDDRVWTISYFAPDQGTIAEARINDGTMSVTDVRTGPQVGWMLARGLPSAYGRKVNRWWVFIPLCLVFLGGLINWRRPFSLRTLDLLALVSFGISLIFFNQGNLFWSTPLVYPPMIYLAARMLRIGFTHRPRRVEIGERHMLILVALTFALMGFRLGLNNRDSNILDVGYAGVVGADRLMNGVLPYGHMPVKEGKPCAGRYANGDPIGYVQSTNGRCESPIASGDTYGPTVYLSYIPFVAAFGWSGRWDDLPAAHVASCFFDILAATGLFAAGWRLGNPRLGVLLAFAWTANPFTLYALNMNTNDSLVGALLAWTIAVLSLPVVRGAVLAAAALTKLAPLVMLPLFTSLRGRVRATLAFGVVSLLLLSMLALDANGVRLFWDRTLGYQLGRVTPMSLWTISSYHPGWPRLTWMQHALQVWLVMAALALVVFPRGRKDGAQVAALAGAALIGTQLVATYWFYPYICWWLPLVLLALFLPRRGPAELEPVTPHPAA